MPVLQDLAAEAGIPERTLRRAVETRMLRAHRLSPRKLALGDGEEEYVRRNWSLLQNLREALRTEPNVQLALLFGSAARGEAAPQSDLDVVVAWKDAQRARSGPLLAKLERATGREVDLFEWPSAKKSPLLLDQVVDEGRVIVDRGYIWPRLLADRDTISGRARRHERQLARDAEAALSDLATPRGS